MKSHLLSSVNGDGNVADGQIQILAVAQAKVSHLYAAISRPAWGKGGGLVFPLCLGVQTHMFKEGDLDTHEAKAFSKHPTYGCQ